MSNILEIIKKSQKDLTSNDPVRKARAEEIKRRYEQGLFNAELTKAGLQPVPIKQKKIDLSALKAIPQQEGLQSIPGATRKEDVSADFFEGLKEMQDVLPTRGQAAAEDIKNMGSFKTFGQGGFGALAQGVGAFLDTAGIVAKTAAKMAMTPDQEAQWQRGLESAAQNPAVKTPVELVTNAIESIRESNPELANSIGDAFTLSEFIVGGSKPVLEGVEAVVEAGKMAGPAVKKGVSVGAKAMGEVAQTAGSAAKAAIPDTSGVAQSLVANINRINPSKRQEFRMMQGKSEEEWLMERGIVGSREETIKKLADNFTALRQNVDDAMAKVPGTFRDNRITAVADESLAHAKAVESPELPEIQALADKAKSTGITMSEMNRLKRYYERNVKVGYLKDPTKTAEVVQLATNRDSALREYQFEMADKAGFDNLRQLNKEIQANKFLADEIAGKMEGQGANNLMSLTDWIVATPGITTDPSFFAGFAAKKLISSEFMRVAAAKVLAGFPKQKPLPRADMDEIEKRAQAYLQKQETMRAETEQMALLADELQKSGLTMSEGTRAFITENPIPLSQNEQALIKAAKNRAEQQQMVQYILEMRSQGKAVGPGFTMQDVDNVPILNPKDRFDENKMRPDIQFDAEPESFKSGETTKPDVNTQATELIKKAEAYQPEFESKIKNLANKLGVEYRVGSVKKLARVVEKTETDYGGNLDELLDVNRSVVFVDSLEVESTLIKLIEAAREEFGGITRVKKTLGTPSYNKVLVNVPTPAGNAEIQITTPKLWEAKKSGGDVLYSMSRSPNTKDEFRAQLDTRIEDIYTNFGEDALSRAAKSIKENGGVTMDVIRDVEYGGTPYISVSPFPERTMIIDGEVTGLDIANYLKQNADFFESKNYALGGWYNTDTKQTYLDVAVTVAKEKRGKAIELSKKTNQIAAFDLENFTEIKTGGTGEAMTDMMSVEERKKFIAELLDNE